MSVRVSCLSKESQFHLLWDFRVLCLIYRFDAFYELVMVSFDIPFGAEVTLFVQPRIRNVTYILYQILS